MKKESFIVYTRFYKPIQRLTDEQLGRLFRALFEYNSTDESISVDEDIEMAFGFFSNQMDIDNAKWLEKVEKLRANAKASKSKQLLPNATKSNQIALVNVNENVNVNDNVNVIKEKDKEKVAVAPLAPKSSPIKRFVKPTLLELQQYCQEARLHINCDAFLDYYEANGWKVGRDSMKDWRAAARNWARRQVPEKRSNIVDNIHNIGDFSNERTRI